MRSRWTAAGSSIVSLIGLSSRISEIFNCSAIISTLIGCEQEVAVDDHAHREAWPDRDRGLNIQIATNELLAGLVETVGATAAERGHDRAVAACRSEFGADPKHGGERGRHVEAAPVMIDFVFEAG